MPPVTVEELTKAIRRTLVAHGKLPDELAEDVAIQVLNYFGSESVVLDNILASEDRDIFYKLEEEGLLSSEVENTTVDKGKNWRIHYWLLNKGAVLQQESLNDGEDTGPESLYRKLSQEGWARTRPSK